MPGYWAVNRKNTMLSTFGAAAVYASLHTADPGSAGSSEAAVTRVPVTWGTPTGGVIQSSAFTFTGVPAGTYLWIGFWGSASGGTYEGKLQLPGSGVVFTGSGSLPISSVSWDLNANPSA